ncbi:MAG: SIS domain-containing protein [Candidatus Levybacteria bacterium]|nr:SIS domain-containing protein [Candidatus Levybacteria bacterium]
MIISRTPLRISFVGGGSDISSFYKHKPGAVVSTAINKYVYVTLNKQFDGRIILNYSKTEVVKKVDDIENNLIREAMKLTGVTGGIHITSIADIPSEGTGMGSSSSYIVGLLNALYAYKGESVSQERLAQEACKIEIDILKKPIGKQDQYIAAYGGFKYFQFNPDNSVHISPINSSPETLINLQKNLILLYTGITRSADVILAKQTKNMADQNGKRRIMTQMVDYAKKIRTDLGDNNLDSFGKLLHKNWLLKKKMAQGVSIPQIDSWYQKALKNGAIGGKILGAGGGGFLLLYAPVDKHEKIKEALPELIPLDFGFEAEGSKIIFRKLEDLNTHQFVKNYLSELKTTLDSLDLEKIEEAIDLLIQTYNKRRKVFIFGNGGSASTATHMACDLGKGTLQRVYDNNERRLKVISLNDNVALITAFANDLSFDDIFSQQLRNLVDSDDLVIALSGSGNSKNVVKALKYAKECGAKTIGILGFKTGGEAGKLVDCAIIANTNHYGQIEDIQLILDHILTSWIARVKSFHDGNEGLENENKAVPFK